MSFYHDLGHFFWDYSWINTSTSLPHSSLYTISAIRGTTRDILRTPNVRQAAIDHYGCSSLLGIQIGHVALDNTVL